MHGFGEDGAGELYALVTNTPANGTGGIVYKLIPEPGSFVLLGIGILGALVLRGGVGVVCGRAKRRGERGVRNAEPEDNVGRFVSRERRGRETLPNRG